LIARGRNALLALALLLTTSCVTFDVYRVETVDTLFFGTERPDHTFVTQDEWIRFLHEVVEPKLEGFTTWDAAGEWSDHRRVVHEPSHVVQIVHGGSADAAIKEIIAAYKQRFSQDSVMRIHAHAGVAFQ